MIWMLILMVLLVLCSAFFSSSEISYATANKLHIRSAAEAGDRRAKGVQWISDHFPKFLSTILVGNNLVNIAFSSVMTLLFADLVGSRGENAAPFVSTAVLLILGVITMFLANRLTRPLQDLSEAAREVGNGNYDFPLEYDKNDEIGAITRTFRQLVAYVKDQGRKKGGYE